MSMSRRTIVVSAAAAALAQGAAYLLYRRVKARRSASAEPLVFEQMDGGVRGLDARLDSRSGAEMRLREALGQPLLVHFWATWCEPCRTELPELLALRRPRLLLVSVDEGWAVVDHFFANAVPAQVVLDVEGDTRRAFGVTTLPDTYLLDADGRPLARFHGPRAWQRDSARSTLERLATAR